MHATDHDLRAQDPSTLRAPRPASPVPPWGARLDRPGRRLLIGTDAVAVGLAWGLSLTVLAVQVGTVGDPSWLPVWIVVASLVTVAVLAHEQLYLARVRAIRAVEVQRAGHGVLIAAAVLGATDAAIAGPVTWPAVAVATAGSWAAVAVGRTLVHSWLGGGPGGGPQRALLVVGTVDADVTDAVAGCSRSEPGLWVLGVVSPRRPVAPPPVPWVGTPQELEVVVGLTAATAVVVAEDTVAPQVRQQLMRDLRTLDVHVHVAGRDSDGVLRLRPVPLPHRVDTTGGTPGLSTAQHVLKRLFDIVGAAVLSVALLPVLAGAAALLRLCSAGPVLVRDVRHGPSGEQVVIPRLRTRNLPPTPVAQWIGAGCRRLCIDELPQLLSVLAGSMTLVGPRPVWRRPVGRPLDVHAGLIGLRHVGVSVDRQRRADEFYLENWSVGLDVSIIAASVSHVVWRAVRLIVRGDGAGGTATA